VAVHEQLHRRQHELPVFHPLIISSVPVGSSLRSGSILGIVALMAACSGAGAADVPKGIVRGEGAAFADARGPWLPLGATLFWAPWGYKHDRPRLERELALLSRAGVDYIRVLGQVGAPGRPDDSWADRLIDPGWNDACGVSPRAGCGTYDEVIAGLTDLAFDKYGLRVEWTVFGGTGFTPTAESRRALADRVLAMSRGREHKIMHFEIANEFYQNGFEGPEGMAELRELGRYLQDRTAILVALSAPRGSDCPIAQRLHAGGVGDMLTEHFDRSDRGPAGEWEPIAAPWKLQACGGLPPLRSSNEPIGPFSSVRAESDPLRLGIAAAVTYVSGVGAYVLHSGAGIRGGGRADRERGRPANVGDVPGIDAIFRALHAVRRRLPADVANWQRFDATAANDIITVDPPETVAGAFGAHRGDRFVLTAVGAEGRLTLRASAPVEIEIVDPRTGERQTGGPLAAGASLSVGGLPAYLILGRTTSKGGAR
jgi:hypothetical protein